MNILNALRSTALKIKEYVDSHIPLKVSELENDSGYLTSYTETDPTVPAWAKESNKPTYTADEVGAEPTGTAENTVSTHNTSIDAHADIRNELTEHINNERVHITNRIMLTDIANGYDYFIFMENGVLTSAIKINRIKVTTLPNKTNYSDTDVFDPTGMIVVAVSQDGSEREITDYTHSQWVEIGSTEFEISYEECGNIYTTTIPVTTRALDQALVDFEYTTNEDGTYTITSWKETFNGEPSTKCAIPNSELVNL